MNAIGPVGLFSLPGTHGSTQGKEGSLLITFSIPIKLLDAGNACFFSYSGRYLFRMQLIKMTSKHVSAKKLLAILVKVKHRSQNSLARGSYSPGLSHPNLIEYHTNPLGPSSRQIYVNITTVAQLQWVCVPEMERWGQGWVV